MAQSKPSSSHGTTRELGTAVNVQQMVFGNSGERSGTGVAFSRNNVTGEHDEPFGDFLINAQGEDVVAGIRTPRPLAELKGELPEAFTQLVETMDLLEKTYHNMQDVEFTIEDGRLYMLQTRRRHGRRGACHLRRGASRACRPRSDPSAAASAA
jgi:pyruvate,orthophosphate dikinase